MNTRTIQVLATSMDVSSGVGGRQGVNSRQLALRKKKKKKEL